MRPFCLQFTHPLLDDFSLIGILDLHQLLFYSRMVLLQRLKIPTLDKRVALIAAGHAFSQGTDPDFASRVSATLSAAWTQLHSLHAAKAFHKFVEPKLFRSILFQCRLTTLDDLLVFSRKLLYRTIAAQAIATPDSAKTDLVFHVFEAFNQPAFPSTFRNLNIAGT
jgi:hypothetical protein